MQAMSQGARINCQMGCMAGKSPSSERERGHSGLKEGWGGLKDEAARLRFEEEREEE